MWKFADKICPRCAVDLTTAEPERIRWRWLHPYSRCPNCGDVCPVIEVEPGVAELEPGDEPPPESTPDAEPAPVEVEAEPEPEPKAPAEPEAEPEE